MMILFLLTVLVFGLPSHAAETDILSEMESHFQNILEGIEQSEYSAEEVVKRLKTFREMLHRQIRTKTRTELEALLSQDALYIGPLPVLEENPSGSGRDRYQLLSPQQLRSRAQDIAQKLTAAFEQSRDHALKLVKQFGAEYGTCRARDVLEAEIPLVELTTWADSYDFRANKERGIRRFNETFHRLKTEAMQRNKIMAFDCMIAGLIHRTTNKDDKTTQELSGRPTVIDADTLLLSGTRIRLHGIDAPEKEQRCAYSSGREYLCGIAATEDLRAKIGDASVRCVITGRGKYQRLIGHCYLGDMELNHWLVEHGYALAYRPSSTQYVAEEQKAQAARRGIWSGAFEKPWEWRQRH